MRHRAPGATALGRPARRSILLAVALAAAAATSLVLMQSASRAVSGGSPYDVPLVVDTNPDPDVVATRITSDEAPGIDIGNGVTANAQTFNGTIPGPTFKLKVGDTVIVRYENRLEHASGIHWHGIELANAIDGTPFTQNMVEPGDNFLYKFTVTRPGLFWYHPHHHSSTNQVFKGLYGMIIVEDPNEDALQASGVLPSDDQTLPIVLSDTTVCKAAGGNDLHTYDDNDDATMAITAPWAGSGVPNALPHQDPPTPDNLCDGPAVGANPYPIDEDGTARGPFAAGEIPNIQTFAHNGRTNEGQIVLTNGKNVGGRAGGPSAEGYVPGALAPGASTLDVRPGQGLRLQIVNASAVRYMRLRLTRSTGTQIQLVRVGGEGGLLNEAVVDGGLQGGWQTKYSVGEILLPPGTRADVVAAIPAVPATGVLTLWTRDFSRTGAGFSKIATVPVMHLNLSGPAVAPAYTISGGTDLRLATGDPVETLGAASGVLLDPAGFAPPKLGYLDQNIMLTQDGTTALGVDNVFGTHDVAGDYKSAAHLGSTRYAEQGDILQLTTENTTGANHPFHLHGFSIQPRTLDGPPFGAGGGDYTWPYPEFRDNVDVPDGYRLIFRIRLDPRPLVDGVTPGGALGRWVFHCHIFFHATNGMLSELVITPPTGNERPDINVDNSFATVRRRRTARMTGTFGDRDGNPVTLSASKGSVTDTGGGTFSWRWRRPRGGNRIVYITATDSNGLKGQIPLNLNKWPEIRRLRVQPSQFMSRARIRFILSEPARVRFVVRRGAARARFRRNFRTQGRKSVRFRAGALPPGLYTLTAVARDSSNLTSRRYSTRFRILP